MDICKKQIKNWFFHHLIFMYNFFRGILSSSNLAKLKITILFLAFFLIILYLFRKIKSKKVVSGCWIMPR